MSFAKRELERQMEEGFTRVPGCYVCARCFSDEAVKDFIEGHATKLRCTYCKRRGKEPVAASLDDVMSHLSRGLRAEYEDPANSVGVIDGEYAIPPTDTIDLLDEHDTFSDSAPQELRDDIASAFSDRMWVRIDPYGLPEEDELAYTWDEFARQVQHSVRYLFYKIKVRRPHDFRPEPRSILESMSRIVESLKLVVRMERGSKFVRAREHSANKKISLLKDIGPPPPESAAQSRFSPVGIPMFYGAEDRDTARIETVSGRKHRIVTFGHFVSLRSLWLLDLRNLPPVPSIFEADHERRAPLMFMHYFRKEAGKAVSKDGREHIEYVPSQVVSEYFRHVFRYNRRKLDGILYESVKNPGKWCATLFLEEKDCTTKKREKGAVLFLEKLETEAL